jgi:hypothetical protein
LNLDILKISKERGVVNKAGRSPPGRAVGIKELEISPKFLDLFPIDFLK